MRNSSVQTARTALLLLVAGSFTALQVAAAAAEVPPKPPPKYTWQQGALAAGGDLQVVNATVAEAEALCDKLAACAGFTFEAPSKDPPGPVKAYLKESVNNFNADAAWNTFVKYAPPRPPFLASYFQSHMVLQHDRPCLWGVRPAGASAVTLTVAGSPSAPAARQSLTGAAATWRACLDPQAPGPEPKTVSVSLTTAAGKQETIVLADVLFGDVWVASGQSNMAFTVSQAFNSTAECSLAAATVPGIRLFSVAVNNSAVPLEDFPAEGIRLAWSRSSPAALCGGDFDYFSAVAWFFARGLHRLAPATPIGIMVTSVPGTDIESWSSAAAMAVCNVSGPPSARARSPEAHRWNLPALRGKEIGSNLWNAMVAPLTPLNIKGVVWYQGEANVGRPGYECRFKAMISDWRRQFNAGANTSFPFIFVQLAPYYMPDHSPPYPGCLVEGGPDSGGQLPAQRLRQLAALELPNVGMASAVDLGDAASPYWPGPVHPRDKQPVGDRLAREAARLTGLQPALSGRGPRLASIRQLPDDADARGSYHSKNTTILRMHFASTGEGLEVTSFSSVAFVALSFDQSPPAVLPGAIMTTNVTAESVDVYFNLGFGNALTIGGVRALHFDFPIVPVFSRAAHGARLPMEPFDVNLTADASGRLCWNCTYAPASPDPHRYPAIAQV